MHISKTLLFATLAAASAFVASPVAQPTSKPAFCTSQPVISKISSISANDPHPSVFCAAVLGVPSKTVTTTFFSRVPGSTSKILSTSSITTTSYTSTSNKTVVVSTYTECISGSPAGKVKRAATKTSAARLSEACTCIGTHPGTITTTVTAQTTAPAKTISKVTTTISTVTTVSTTTTTVISGFRIQVSDFQAAQFDESSSYSGDYLDVTAGSGSSSGVGELLSDADVHYALSPCNELVVIDSTIFTRSIGYALGQYLASSVVSFQFQLAEEGFQTAQCDIDAEVLTCSVGDHTFNRNYREYAFLVGSGSESSGNPNYGSEIYKVMYD